MHRHRQNDFLAECQRHHKAKGREYVAVIDPDEFVTYNVIADDEPDKLDDLVSTCCSAAGCRSNYFKMI
jgi:hypothetical protein